MTSTTPPAAAKDAPKPAVTMTPAAPSKEPTDVELAKARFRAAAASIDPLKPVREHPLIATGVAFAGGIAMGGFPVGIRGIGLITRFTLKTLIPHLIPMVTSAAGIASSVAAHKAASKTKDAATASNDK